MSIFLRMALLALLICGGGGAALADLNSDIGYTQLAEELGDSRPTSAGVKVTQVEADADANINTWTYRVDSTNSQFSDKTILFMSGTTPVEQFPCSGHATAVGQYFYGLNTSIAPGITNINNYAANQWVGAGFLNFGYSSQPRKSSDRVANHSYVGYLGGSGTDPVNVLALKRLDWVVDRDEYIQVVGMNNGTGNQVLWGSSFNAIAVGLSSAMSATGAVNLNSPPYGAGRTRPDLVVPLSVTSYATPVVSAAAALLVEVGHNDPGLSRDPVVNYTYNRNGDQIYNAERSEVAKAALMAGADRNAAPLATTYEVNTANGLNSTYGAGQLHIANSYHIIAAGEQNSREDFAAGGGEILAAGFDYDPQFGGGEGSNRTGSYIFKALTTGSLSASLVWNLSVDGGTASTFDYTTDLYHLGLYLYDLTTASELACAVSAVDNTESIWWTDLIPLHDYKLLVIAEQTDFLWDYGLAWDITATTTHAPLPPTAWLLGSTLLGLALLRRLRRRQS